MQPAENDLQIASARLELTAATEKSLNLLRKFPLKSLICPAKMTDDGLVIIGSFPQLESLVLSRQQRITDAGLKHLSNLKTLQSITLEGTNISDAGIQHLRGLTELTRLALDNTKVGDETLRLAETMPKLKQISVHGTKVSVAALRRFDKARPDCALGAPFFVRER
jgi:Leucine-rich repeat (LRR) protein